MPNSQRPHGLQPTRFLHPWDFPGRSTGVGCHCLLLLITREMQINTAMKCHLTPVKMAIIKKSSIPSSREDVGTLLHYWWECELVQSSWKTVQSFLKQTKIGLPYDPAILLLGIHLDKTTTCKDTCTSMLIAVLFTVVKTRKQSKCPSMDG